MNKDVRGHVQPSHAQANLPTLVCGCRSSGACRRMHVSVVLLYIASKELSLGLSVGRPGKVTTNLPGRPAPKTSRKNGSL